MLIQRPKIDIIEIFKKIRYIYDIIFISIGGSLWIFSTLWDIYKLQRYWLDYSIEFYSSFLIFYMIIYSINPKALPVKIYYYFKLITTVRGRGILLIIISSLFLKDKHAFHKFCAIILFIGGILYLICEILVPTTKEELQKIESMYNNTNNRSSIINNRITNNINSNKKNNINNENNNNKSINSNNNDNTEVNIINENLNDLIKENEEKDGSNSKITEKESNKENKENNEEDNENETKNNLISEIVRKTDNPYEIPEDF